MPFYALLWHTETLREAKSPRGEAQSPIQGSQGHIDTLREFRVASWMHTEQLGWAGRDGGFPLLPSCAVYSVGFTGMMVPSGLKWRGSMQISRL